MTDGKIRVRYAPSPTGHLHIGNARTALFNYLFARHNGGTMVLRIEDTDTKRNIEGGTQSQIDMLHWLGIDWDEGPDVGGDYGPYRQSERRDIYDRYIKQLLDEGKAYESYMTEDELAAQREAQKAAGQTPRYEYEYAGMSADEKAQAIAAAKAKGLQPVIRFRVPKDHTYAWDDIVKGKISFDSDDVGGDWVIQKRDGMPTYNFAVVIDDHLMAITHVLRGDDHIANTPKQLMIYEAFGWTPPAFGHMTLIINTETGKKLSKRDESVLQFIEQYRELGYLPDAMFNFITLLGWSPVGTNEIFTRKQFIKQFDPERLSRSPAKFDAKKLEWVNNQYVKKANPSTLLGMSLRNWQDAGRLPKDEQLDAKTLEWLRAIVGLFQDQMSFTQQIVKLSEIFFIEPPALTDQAKEELSDPLALPVLQAFQKAIQGLPQFTAYAIQNAIYDISHETGAKGRKLYMPIRIATTRETHGPQLAESIEILGLEKVNKHLELTLKEMASIPTKQA
ncbi:glutamate--tRNA ligase [Schleiferilactobacillus shenzhenensis]|uniref:glutamate--tRNA ligase n=1 Tax=Schleiferilactobacillus shenzhenensis TaxID=1231337 RepID=UPI0003F8FF08|nr:glutamate--tRNA ligase [Schleiferilactobacillus shenzhenensis]